MEKTPNYFSKFSLQNVGPNLYGKNENTAFREIDFIQKLRIILPSCNQHFKDEPLIFSTSTNMSQNIGKF
jgi:hypothetical protein